MSQQSAIHSTFVIERTYSASPERVFAAFANPAKKRHWYAEGRGHDVEEFEMEFRVGGRERLLYRMKEGTPIPCAVIAADGSYLDIVPGRRVVMASTMAMGKRRISASLVTVEVLPAGEGTDLILTHQGAFFEGSDGLEFREAGWQELLERFAKELNR